MRDGESDKVSRNLNGVTALAGNVLDLSMPEMDDHISCQMPHAGQAISIILLRMNMPLGHVAVQYKRHKKTGIK